MTEKQFRVEQCKLDIRDAESRLREARKNLEEGHKKGLAQVEQARADMERDYTRLKEEVDRATTKLALEKAYLARAETELAKGFDS